MINMLPNNCNLRVSQELLLQRRYWGSYYSKAVTLTELLVVIVILGLLMALMFPALGKGRAQALKTRCVSNCAQVVLAWTMYSHDNADHLVPNVDGKFGGLTNWVSGNMADKSDALNPALLVDESRSLIATYLRESAVFKCPSDRSPHVRSISMNCRMNPTREASQGQPRWVGGVGESFLTFRKLAQIGAPGDILVTLDEDARHINDAYFAIDMSNTGDPSGVGPQTPYYIVDYPGRYHSDGTTISFADGHVAVHKWLLKIDMTSATSPQFMPSPNSDVQWLQSHSTYAK